jgi:hypothetical protein
MWDLANRITRTISDMTVGTVIVLVHVALADREHEKRMRKQRESHQLPS